jgi:hypothetical protein
VVGDTQKYCNLLETAFDPVIATMLVDLKQRISSALFAVCTRRAYHKKSNVKNNHNHYKKLHYHGQLLHVFTSNPVTKREQRMHNEITVLVLNVLHVEVLVAAI